MCPGARGGPQRLRRGPALRVAHSLLCGVLLGVCAAEAASAATVTVTMTGTWGSVADTAAVLDGSIVLGGAFTATFVYDDQVADCEPHTGIGCYFMNGSVGTLAFTTGNYSFLDQGIALNGVTTEYRVNGFDAVGLFFDRFLLSGSLPPGVTLDPMAYANPTFFDFSRTALTSDRLTDVPWDVSLWNTNFYFFGPVTNTGAQDYIEFDGVITGLTVSVPEAGAAWLLGLAGIACALHRRANT
jgi:hypothetical protein